jgi:2,4-dienoyl-CoA reductase-like NADH-dependent reductase (Old Yellow Enzyme family)/thioredoxin reductase
MIKRKLLEPFRIGKMQLKNRIVMAPMETQYATDEGYVSERTKNYYEARARGGAALIIVEATYIHQQGWAHNNQITIGDDKYIPGLSELVQTIHKHGAKAAIQINHAGREAKVAFQRGIQTVSSSPQAGSLVREKPKELTVEEIEQIINLFARAALRAKKAGFDGVEIHGAHGYLISQFLSRASNKRQDIYGGDLPNRARFLVEVIKAIKRAVGDDYPVWCRINGMEYGVAEGITLEEAQATAQLAQEAGVDAIHVSATGPKALTNLPSHTYTPAVISDLAEGVKKAATVPVIAVGKMTPEAAENVLAEGKADLIAIGRALFADPELPNKVAEDRLEDIIPCIECFGCRNDVFSNILGLTDIVGIGCHVNPVLGKEKKSEIIPVKKPRKILVVGGGPAGMEAARLAAYRGHSVTLWEKGPSLGGQLIQATIPPYKDRINALLQYYERQLVKLNVAIELHKEVTAAMIEEFNPDTVILATGVRPLIPTIPSLDRADVVQAGDVLESSVPVGDRVIIIGGELVGCETAEFLAEKGKKVTIMRRGPEIATKVGPCTRPSLLGRLVEKNVTLLPDIKYNKVTPSSIVVTNKDGERKTIEADTIVLAAGAIPENKLYKDIKGGVKKVHCIGDCVEPRTIRAAIADGFNTGLEI